MVFGSQRYADLLAAGGLRPVFIYSYNPQRVASIDSLGHVDRFDEYIGYRTWEEHEYKAFMEFVDETGFEFEYVAYGLTYTILRLL